MANINGFQNTESVHFLDAQEQANGLTGWNQEYLQLSAGIYHGTFRQMQGIGIRLFVEEVQQSVFQTGVVPSGTLALGLPLNIDGTGIFCGVGCGADSLHVFSGSDGFEFRTPRHHTMLGVELRVGQDSLRQISIGQDPWQRLKVSGQPDAVVLGENSFHAVRSYLLAFAQSATSNPILLDKPAIVSSMSDFLIYHMSLADPHGKKEKSCHKHWVLVRHACALANETIDVMPTVAQLCFELEVSRRTIQLAFQQVLGIGPLMYTRAVRLNRARRMLRQTSSVTDAATACGFWHFGHFSQDYHSMFGELPSDTLRGRRLM